MADPDPLWTDLRQQVTRLGAELKEMFNLRWQLAVMELRADLESAKRLVLILGAAIVTGLTALPLLGAAAADALDGSLGISRTVWLLIFGSLLLAIACSAAWFGWRRFRRRLIGLEETLEELRDDVAWLRQWAGAEEQASQEKPSRGADTEPKSK